MTGESDTARRIVGTALQGVWAFCFGSPGRPKKGGLLSLSHRSKCLASKPRNRSITLSWKSSLPFSDMHLLWGPRLLVIVGHSWERKGEPLFWNWKGHPRLPQTMALLGEEGRKKQTLIKLNPAAGSQAVGTRCAFGRAALTTLQRSLEQ